MTSDLAKRDDLDMGIDISSIMMIVMMLAMVSLLSGMATSTAQTAQVMQAMQLQGKSKERTFVVTDELTYWDLISNEPYTLVQHAYFENDGPNEVRVAANNPDDTHIVGADDHFGIDRYMATERISTIFLKCRGGETAVVHVYVEY